MRTRIAEEQVEGVGAGLLSVAEETAEGFVIAALDLIIN